MADIGISSNSVLTEANFISGDDSTNSSSENGCNETGTFKNNSGSTNNEHKPNLSEQRNIIAEESKCETEATSSLELTNHNASQPLAGNSEEPTKIDASQNNHTVWIPPPAIKSEVEELEGEETGSGDEENSENEEEKEGKMEDESDSEDDDSEGGAYHLAEVSYGEEDEQDSERGTSGETESILGMSHDLPDYPTSFNHDGIMMETRSESLMEFNSPMAGRYLFYFCQVCGYKAHGKDTFLNHVQSHTGLFGKEAHDKRPYRRIKHPERELFHCVVCEFKSNNKDTITKHLLDNHPLEFSYCCATCEFKTNKFSKLRSHMSKHHYIYSCHECDYKTERYPSLREHYRTHTKEKPYSCGECTFRCSSKNSLGKHMRIHTGETPYHCKLCDRKFKQSGHLTEHMRQHTGEKPFTCPLCDYRCAYRGLINKHIKSHSDEKPFACTVCSFKSKNQYSLTTHMRLHTGEKAYACKLCDFSCNTSSTFRDHAYKHNGKLPPHVCDLCGARFVRERFLKRHAAAHKRTPTIVCSVCGKLFISRMKLHEHYTTHPKQS